jgi:hypothetical protein
VKPEVILTNFFAEPTVLLVPITSRVIVNILIIEIVSQNENMESMTKDTFVIRIYSVTGRRYVMKKVDELTKNRREICHVICYVLRCLIKENPVQYF